MIAFEIYVLEQFLKIRNKFALRCQDSLYERMKSVYCAANWSLLSCEDLTYYYQLQAFSEEASNSLCVIMPSIDSNTQKITFTPIQQSADTDGNIQHLSIEQVMTMVFTERSTRSQKIAEEVINSQISVKKSSSNMKLNELHKMHQNTHLNSEPEITNFMLELNENSEKLETKFAESSSRPSVPKYSNAPLLTDDEITFLEKELQSYKTQFDSNESGVNVKCPNVEYSNITETGTNHSNNVESSVAESFPSSQNTESLVVEYAPNCQLDAPDTHRQCDKFENLIELKQNSFDQNLMSDGSMNNMGDTGGFMEQFKKFLGR